jgi:hypothetical protein
MRPMAVTRVTEFMKCNWLINFFGGRVTEFKKCVNSIEIIVLNFLEGLQNRISIWFALCE